MTAAAASRAVSLTDVPVMHSPRLDRCALWCLVFLVVVSLGLPALVLLAYAMLDQSVTITQMPQGCADTEKHLQTLVY